MRHRDPLRAGPAAALCLLAAPCVSAQGVADPAAPTGPTETSFFGMFFWSDDPVGLLFIWVLVGLSMLSLTLAIRFGMQFRRSNLLPPELGSELRALLAERRFREALDAAKGDPSLLGTLAGASLAEAPGGYEAMERTLFEAGDAETARVLRPLEALNVLGNIAPMMGLFGTVYGMIVAFQSLVSSGGSPDPVELAGGISTALVTTLWGLVVAIPALAAYALLHNRVDAIAADAVLEAESILRPFRPARGASPTPKRKAAATPTPAAPAPAPPPPAPTPAAPPPPAPAPAPERGSYF